MNFVRIATAIVALGVCSHGSLGKPQKTEKAGKNPGFGQNLLKNAGAEESTEDTKKVPGWPAVDGFSVATYGSVGGEWDWGVAGCAQCGKQYLRLSFEGETKLLSVSQTVDVGFAAREIDQSTVTARIWGQLGGYVQGDTTSQLLASFQDENGKELGVLGMDPVDSTKLSKPTVGGTSLMPVEKSGKVPPGTRKIVFTWKAIATGDSGAYIALADNLGLELSAEKE
ncbi:MAG TPA: hypothetical protein VMH20_01985 [Verrucomicrobiae bacterium]|nr:hypothetical protein [Verrucomicrobiae bacterium]